MSIKTYIDNAIREGKSITIKYVKYNGEISTRTLSDLQYSDEFGSDYVVGFCSLRQEKRTFKISRIREVDGVKASAPNVFLTKDNSSYTPDATRSQSSPSTISRLSKASNPSIQPITSSSSSNSSSYRPSPSSYSYHNNSNTIHSSNSSKKEGCYIATMVYGDYNNPNVLVLRKFRDERLLTNVMGSLFVRFYYWLSPRLVKRLENKKRINAIIHYLLNRIVMRLSK